MQKSAWCDIRAIASRSIDAAATAARAAGHSQGLRLYEDLLADPRHRGDLQPAAQPPACAADAASARAPASTCFARSRSRCRADEAAQLARGRATGQLVMPKPSWCATIRSGCKALRAGARGAASARSRVVQMLLLLFQLTIPTTSATSRASAAARSTTSAAIRSSAGRFFFQCRARAGHRAGRPRPEVPHRPARQRAGGFRRGPPSGFQLFDPVRALSADPVDAARPNGIEIQVPVNAAQGAKTTLLIDDGSPDGTGIRTETIAESDQYMLQGEVFSRAVRGEMQLSYGGGGRDRRHARPRCAVPL